MIRLLLRYGLIDTINCAVDFPFDLTVFSLMFIKIHGNYFCSLLEFKKFENAKIDIIISDLSDSC